MRHLNKELRDASNDGNLENVKRLLHEGAEINAYNHYHSTALMYAAYEGHLHVVQFLLQQGADIHARDYYHSTALTYALLRCHFNIIHVFLDSGCDINLCTLDGQSVLTWVLQFNQSGIAKLLIKYGAKFEDLDILKLPETGSSAFSNHIAQGRINQANALYHEHPELLNHPNKFGQTPLMRAVICGQLGAVHWLIDHGANVDAQSTNGFSALYFAARAFLSHQHKEEQASYRTMLEMLMEHGANLDEQTQRLIEQDKTDILHGLINPGGYILK